MLLESRNEIVIGPSFLLCILRRLPLDSVSSSAWIALASFSKRDGPILIKLAHCSIDGIDSQTCRKMTRLTQRTAPSFLLVSRTLDEEGR